MKRFVLSICLLLAVPRAGVGAGLTQHQFMADIAYDLVSTAELADCIGGHWNDYLAGASFPDTGYAMGNAPLSEDAHGTAFVSAFVAHLRQGYPSTLTEECGRISFLMGVASHVADDPPYHSRFIAQSAEQDFNGNYDLAHTFCDSGLDFVSIVEHDRWADIPAFRLPLADIMAAYDLLGSTYPEDDVILGNKILLVAAFAERLVSRALYVPLTRIMPWTTTHYYDYPEGGLFDGGAAAAEYYEAVWSALITGEPTGAPDIAGFADPAGQDAAALAMHESREGRRFLHDFARKCLDEKAVRVETTRLADGSVILRQPKILNMKRFVNLLRATLSTHRGR